MRTTAQPASASPALAALHSAGTTARVGVSWTRMAAQPAHASPDFRCAPCLDVHYPAPKDLRKTTAVARLAVVSQSCQNVLSSSAPTDAEVAMRRTLRVVRHVNANLLSAQYLGAELVLTDMRKTLMVVIRAGANPAHAHPSTATSTAVCQKGSVLE